MESYPNVLFIQVCFNQQGKIHGMSDEKEMEENYIRNNFFYL